MKEQLYVLANRQTGTLVGLTRDEYTESTQLETWPLDDECAYFLEALQAYVPRHVLTVDDIKKYYAIMESRVALDWALLSEQAAMQYKSTSKNKLRFTKVLLQA
ncbi:hypothetical protein SOM55_01725 [Pseudomonas coleopterorum]|uniref:hypothetical protein n=1 Tax=Pseudomonas coleopterorum TaxID=1605838 RepID=UPI002A6B5166|nr:hypothetical protein [Pseudomonas coleopterorum]MDY1045521.1 hypothetical protein [Pseudomonas coleopterorum]